jgi:hypothetical protein
MSPVVTSAHFVQLLRRIMYFVLNTMLRTVGETMGQIVAYCRVSTKKQDIGLSASKR